MDRADQAFRRQTLRTLAGFRRGCVVWQAESLKALERLSR
mgnify:CR=1 FL=1|jgi:hypothetical protein